VSLLQRSVAVEIDSAFVTRLKPSLQRDTARGLCVRPMQIMT
jgi:hypothetical protein